MNGGDTAVQGHRLAGGGAEPREEVQALGSATSLSFFIPSLGPSDCSLREHSRGPRTSSHSVQIAPFSLQLLAPSYLLF